ncbi:MAG TPA: site-specific DNA-methyltransferase, partial [Firmicutes bacterium]|nr:site-specific DNA-methyltransferase [Candidatus Fermentithermobacillaceae bacterium]
MVGVNTHIFYLGNTLDVLRTLPDESVHCCVTSPPYWGLRDYGVLGQIGLEPTPDEYVAKMVEVFREVRRVLRDDGTLWLNLGDSYASAPPGNVRGVSEKSGLHGAATSEKYRETLMAGHGTKRNTVVGGLKPKDLVGIPWRVAFALQADGWYLRSDIIWCLSGGTWVYARTQKGDMPMTIKDMARLDPKTVQLWNGSQW